MWPSITPVLFIPVVGNVVAPLAGVSLGHEVWSVMQLAIGVFFWPVVMALLVARRVGHSPLPDRILPSWFISLAPPSVIGLSLMQYEAPLLWVQAVWGVGAFVLGWVFQFVGHHWEGRKPAFADDLVGLLVGPAFVLGEALFALGLCTPMAAAIEREAGRLRGSGPTTVT